MRIVPLPIISLLVILCYGLTADGQSRVLRGTVIDATNHEPLSNASIYDKAARKGTRSDSLGRFTLSVPDGSAGTTLVVSIVGYKSQTILVTAAAMKDSFGIALVPEAQKMQQVVVTNAREGKYRNKNNPAVELIRKVIANKDNNRPESLDYGI